MRRLSREQDAFGREIWDLHNGAAVGPTIVERDDDWVSTASGSLYFTEYADWPEQEKKAIRLAKGRILDVGCGAGRVGLCLQKEGLEVLSLDNSPLAVKVCRLRGLKKTRLASLTEFRAPAGSFDTIVMYGNNFGLVANFKRAKWLLKRWHNMTTPPARILAATVDPYQTRVPEHVEYHRRNRARGRMGGQVRIRVRYRRCATPWLDLLLVSKEEMKDIVEGTGWRVARFFDSRGSGYVAVLEKVREQASAGSR